MRFRFRFWPTYALVCASMNACLKILTWPRLWWKKTSPHLLHPARIRYVPYGPVRWQRPLPERPALQGCPLNRHWPHSGGGGQRWPEATLLLLLGQCLWVRDPPVRVSITPGQEEEHKAEEEGGECEWTSAILIWGLHHILLRKVWSNQQLKFRSARPT